MKICTDESIIKSNHVDKDDEKLKREIFDIFAHSSNKPLSDEEIATILDIRRSFAIAEDQTHKICEWFFRDLAHTMINSLLPMIKNNNYSQGEIVRMFGTNRIIGQNIRAMAHGRRKPFTEYRYWLNSKGNLQRARAVEARKRALDGDASHLAGQADVQEPPFAD